LEVMARDAKMQREQGPFVMAQVKNGVVGRCRLTIRPGPARQRAGHYSGARANAWCLRVHAEASVPLSFSLSVQVDSRLTMG
jgi:hypothetical protein